ncbi:LOW QUALITY PROTEIN: uncharacterized protein C22orf15 homolog [Cyanocitta cristata]
MLDETKLKDRDTSSIRTIFPKSKRSSSPLTCGTQHQLPAAMAVMQLLKALLMPHGNPTFAGHSGHLSATCCASCHAHVAPGFGVTTLLSQVSFSVCSQAQRIGNLHCCVQTLTDHLKKCQCRPEDCIDLVDKKGTLMNLTKVEDPASEFTSKYLQERQHYILIRAVREENSEATCYESLLEDLGKNYPDLPGKSQTPTSPLKESGVQHDSCSHFSPRTAPLGCPLIPLCSFRALMAVGSECIQAAGSLLVKSDSRDLLPSHPTPGRGLPSLSPGKEGHFRGTNREGRTSGEIGKLSSVSPRLTQRRKGSLQRRAQPHTSSQARNRTTLQSKRSLEPKNTPK